MYIVLNEDGEVMSINNDYNYLYDSVDEIIEEIEESGLEDIDLGVYYVDSHNPTTMISVTHETVPIHTYETRRVIRKSP